MDALERANEAMRCARLAEDIEIEAKWHVEAQAYASIAIAEQLARIALHLGNIHQAMLTPNADREPVTVADQLKRIADALYSRPMSGAQPIAEVLDDLTTKVGRVADYFGEATK